MKQEGEVRKGAIKYLIILLLQRVIGVGLFFIAAGTFNDLRGTTNLTLYLFVSIVACVIMFSGHQETLNERGKKQKNTKGWDKILLPIYWLIAYFGIYFVAGLGVRLEWSVLSIYWFYIGVILYLISSILTVWSVIENKHFETTARIQDDREHKVITTGPYRIVRHPGYSGIVIWAIASALMFGTLTVGIVAFVIIATICVRTFLEDKMLKEELIGYMEYSKSVRYRLIPFVW